MDGCFYHIFLFCPVSTYLILLLCGWVVYTVGIMGDIVLPSGYHFGSVSPSAAAVGAGSGITSDSVVDDEGESLLEENKDRFVLFPIEHNDIWEFYRHAVANFWVPEEVNFSDDIVHWQERLNDNERHFIKHILAFFAASDGIVNENLAEDFLERVQYTEAKFFYGFQIAVENIHSHTYSLFIDTYITDKAEQEHLLHAVETVPSVKKKADWALRWIEQGSFVERLVAFAIVEGIFFSGSFCSIFWLKHRGLMPGLSFANQLISRDEGLHRDFACLLYRDHIVQKLPRDQLVAIIQEAVALEKEFITESLPVRLIGMNSDKMSQYIEYVTDHLLVEMGLGEAI